ncbi:MAG TPA: mannose-1-phosphate guanylyltransferase/mannose-6-phosphate isomerase [Casimicrobiaceae bacterium]|jgi:mannose-1-phosphate guanylyltransferase/mannose-6-phosphate isomerase|nr:mannose-1-phosphate guanylyltransferase/mannose-6-phosphate isomerase [Casimicrobiaceae bacterium]
MKPTPVVPMILSGGAGTRLWPLSREAAPKPFMPLPDGETLLAKTAHRALALDGVDAFLTITNREYYFHTRDTYAAGGHGSSALYLLEPFGRNTAPAVALGALCAQAKGLGDRVLLVLPADHLISDQQAFADAVARASSLAGRGLLVTFGITPTHPETGFGYIECGAAIERADGNIPAAYRARRFVEKPALSTASDYVADGHYVWNSGMFAFKADVIVDAFAKHAPGVLAAVKPIVQAMPDIVSATILEIDAAHFAAVPDISIDYAIMERAAEAGDVAVVRGRFDWSDVGSWQAVAALATADDDGNRGQGERVAIATRETYVHAADRIVATVGVENLVIVDTPDAVLVAHRDHLQRVKDVVGELKARGHDAYKLHRTVARPWGTYTNLEEAPGFKIKRIEVRPGAALSLQLHHRRSEHWVVVRGVAHVTNGEREFDVHENESTYIPVETKHRLENRQREPLVIIEVQCGDYLGEDDIVRFDDRYGRVPAEQK